MTQMMMEALLWPTITKSDSKKYVKGKEGTPSIIKNMLENGNCSTNAKFCLCYLHFILNTKQIVRSILCSTSYGGIASKLTIQLHEANCWQSHPIPSPLRTPFFRAKNSIPMQPAYRTK
jgi:hypothetical protein